MKNILTDFKKFKIDSKQLRKELGNDLYNVYGIKPEKVYAKDVIFLIKQYTCGAITKQELIEWVNIVWFTDLYIYNHREEDSIASVMELLETIDEEGVNFSDNEFRQMLNALENNKSCLI